MKYCIAIFIRKNRYLRNQLKKYFLKRRNDNNKIVLITKDGQKIKNPKIKNLNVFFKGKNNYVEIYEPIVITRALNISFRGDNNYLKIDKYASIKNMIIAMGEKSTITIGNHFSASSVTLQMYYSNNNILTIGNNCMFSYGINIRVSDTHTIYDTKTKELINPDKDTIIKDHVWLAYQTLILKGSVIPNNCVVGAGAIVTKAFEEENCIIAGIPAKVVKRGINWDKDFPYNWNTRRKQEILSRDTF